MRHLQSLYVDLHGFIWIYVDLHGFTRIYMDLHKFTWIYRNLHGFTWIYMDLYGFNAYIYIYMVDSRCQTNIYICKEIFNIYIYVTISSTEATIS